MKSGFFSSSTMLSKSPPALVPKCESCGLYKHCKSPKMPVDGKGLKKILICAEGPGQTEDNENRPFCGDAGEKLQATLAEFNIDMREDCWIINSISCRATDKYGANRKPSLKEIKFCRPNVLNAIEKLKPVVIILLGDAAVSSVIGWLWKEELGKIGRWVNFIIPNQKPNAWIVIADHPAAMFYQNNPVMELYFRKTLKKAARLAEKGERPWKIVPDWKSECEVILDPKKASIKIKKVIEMNLLTAFDYETNMLKPDSKEAEIVTCSIDNGELSFAFPFFGEAIEATKDFLRSLVPKCGSNEKFEKRWSKKVLGVRVRGKGFCTMIGAHVIDSRAGISSLKFQSFVLLGFPLWNNHIEKFFKSKNSNQKNRIKEIDLKELLVYNCLDSLLERRVALIQMKKLGIPIPGEEDE